MKRKLMRIAVWSLVFVGLTVEHVCVGYLPWIGSFSLSSLTHAFNGDQMSEPESKYTLVVVSKPMSKDVVVTVTSRDLATDQVETVNVNFDDMDQKIDMPIKFPANRAIDIVAVNRVTGEVVKPNFMMIGPPIH